MKIQQVKKEEKICARCETLKKFNEFAKSRRNKDGLQYYCRPCFKEKRRNWLNGSGSYIPPSSKTRKKSDACKVTKTTLNRLMAVIDNILMIGRREDAVSDEVVRIKDSIDCKEELDLIL